GAPAGREVHIAFADGQVLVDVPVAVQVRAAEVVVQVDVADQRRHLPDLAEVVPAEVLGGQVAVAAVEAHGDLRVVDLLDLLGDGVEPHAVGAAQDVGPDRVDVLGHDPDAVLAGQVAEPTQLVALVGHAGGQRTVVAVRVAQLAGVVDDDPGADLGGELDVGGDRGDLGRRGYVDQVADA